MKFQADRITVVGAGMAGSEAALAAAALGVAVDLYEMRPLKLTPAHRTGDFAEMVCSNSFGGEASNNAKGLLQAEMSAAGGIVMRSALANRVPAGGALAVDREQFSKMVTLAVAAEPLITVHGSELEQIPDGIVVLATGPLTSDALAESLKATIGGDFLGFYDAAAPVIAADSIDMDIAYRAGRYQQAADYLNLPFDEEQYEIFYQALSEARKHTPHDWEKLEFFEGCMPIEELARRGRDTPRFGPLKPVGLENPRTGARPYAVAQLRQEDAAGRMWSLVGFQTGLKWGDQKAVVSLIPGLAGAEIVRYGVMHRNTYLNAPALLEPDLSFRAHPRLFTAGVLAGTEGYLESSATGWLAGSNAARRALGLNTVIPPERSMLGGLVRYLAGANPDGFQPMNSNWGLVPDAEPGSYLPTAERVAEVTTPAVVGAISASEPALAGGAEVAPVKRRLSKKGQAKRKRREAMFAQGLRAFEEWLPLVSMLGRTGDETAAIDLGADVSPSPVNTAASSTATPAPSSAPR